jgi:transcriptional regulator with XRE-family HTH domain
LATVLRRHRDAKRLSQEALAEKAGLSPNHIGLLERNGRDNPSLNAINSIAQALGLPLSKLIADAEAVQKNRSQ